MSQAQLDLSTAASAQRPSGNESLCTKLLRSDSEAEVVSILKEAGYWDDASSWRPYGDLSNNYGTIGNQQSEAVAALVEKIVNAIDARLTNECLVRGENPETQSAPQSIREAVHRYFGAGGQFDPDRSGRLSNWTDAALNTQGDFITVTATGHRPEGRRTGRGNHPCITVADRGEGQTPEDFPNTFLSLHRNNKIRTKFVQGKFNMGATGALPYCSERYNLQLIISRRNPALIAAAPIGKDLEWGFTIVRRRDPDEESRSSVFEYLAPVKFDGSQSGEVLSFPADRYPIFPDRNGPYNRMAEYGSLIKLYEYRWQGTTSSIIMPSDGAGLIRRIEIALAEPALPFKLYECRGYQSNENFRSARGILTDLDRNPGDLEAGFPQSVDLAIGKHRIMLRIFAFKPGGYSSHRTTKHGIIFLYNGQLHAAYPTRFFSRQSVRKAHIANDFLVTVDCSNLDRRDFEDLFMNSRDRLRSDSKLTTELVRKIEEFLVSNESLRELENQRRSEAIASKIDDDQSREQLLKQLLDDNPDLSRYLLEGGILVRPGTGSRADSNGRFVGKQFPTYFDPKRREWNVGTGKKAQLEFDTDAENGYFDRSVSHGTWSIVDDDGEDWTNYWDRTGPRDGIVRFYWDTSSVPPSLVKPGQVFLFNVYVDDDSRQQALSNEIMLTFTEPVETPGGGGGRRRNGATESAKLPNIYHVYETDWSSHPLGPFTNKTAVRMAPDSSTPNDRSAWDFYVNVDRGPHTYFKSCLILELGERNSIHGLGISLRHVHGELDHIVSDNELSQITDWLTTVDYGLIFSDDCPCQTFQFGDAKYEATAMHDYDIGKLLISVSYSSHRTIIPDIEDPLDKIVRQTVEWYTPDLLAGIPLVLAILNCSTHKHIDGTTELYGIQYVSIDKASGEVVDSGLDGSGLWRTNRRKMDISQAVPAVWIWQHATDEQPTLYMNPDIEDPVLPSSLFGFAYWRRGDTSMGKIEMECGAGHAAHPGQLSRAHLEYINKHDELRGDKPRHPEVRPFSY